MVKKRSLFFLLLIIVLASFLRFKDIGKVPATPDWDEVAIGYNAYSILKTGKDEYGETLPFVFRSYDDYKPPLYIYLTVPSIFFFGLNIISVRLTSALFGVFAVIGTYFLTCELLKVINGSINIQVKYLNKLNQARSRLNDKLIKTIFNPKIIPLISALLLAISPWHIFFSRVAFEANLAVTFNIWGSVFFLLGLRHKKILILSSIFFVLGIYSYHTERVFIPLYVVLISLSFMKLKSMKIYEILPPLGFAVVMCIPIFQSIFRNDAYKRLESTSIFRMHTELLDTSVQKYNWDTTHGSVIGKILNDRRYEWGKILISGYFSHFSPKWLFATGDIARHHAPDSGLLYLFTLPLIAIGFLSLFGTFSRMRLYILGWLALSPVAASLTFEVPHAVRSMVFIPVFEILASFGVWISLIFIYKILISSPLVTKLLYFFTLFSLFILSIFEIVRYLDLYFIHLNYEYSSSWQYGYKEAFNYVQEHLNKYEQVIVSTGLEQPHMFFLFYLQYPPEKYLQEGGTDAHRFGKYIFRKIDWSREIKDGKTLYVDTVQFTHEPNLLKILSLNGEPVIEISDFH